jgi:pimeloyl-ACP methyl ester carboxylesterase
MTGAPVCAAIVEPMPRPHLRSLLAALAPALALALWPVPASASLNFSPRACPAGTPARFDCAVVTVPRSRAGLVPGTIALKVERKLAGAVPSRDAVIGLAGGPGQAALGLGGFFGKALKPALGSRDLIVFDQRGTGESQALSCPALSSPEEAMRAGSIGELIESCAQQLGPARGAYTTQESVADIEAIREAAGYEKLVLFGVSYGTKVALQYAERYPQHLEALVLDSVVPSSGSEPFGVPSFQAIPGALEELCSQRACAGITANPTADLARLIAKLRKHALAGSVYDGSGHRHTVRLGEIGLLQILVGGDLNPALRALLPAAVVSALRHDPGPLLRLYWLSQGLIPTVPTHRPEPVEGAQSIDETLFADTSCEELPFPWQRAAEPEARMAEALTALRALPGSDFYPFDATTALEASFVPACVDWPVASAPPPAEVALPDVPTLILSGEQDLRTPTADARAVAARIPGAQLLVVPFTGHSVLGTDFSDCAEGAVEAFFAGANAPPCASSSNPFAPTPITPTRLAYIHPPAVLKGKRGQTLTAMLDTVLDLARQVIGATLQANAELPVGSSFGGLRGGYARLSSSSVVLHDFSFVRGVRLSGTFPVRHGRLRAATIRISGRAAAHGAVRLGSRKRVTGRLGGRRFSVSIARVKLARVGARDVSAWGEGGAWAGPRAWAGRRAWPSVTVAFPLSGLARVR